MNTNITPILLVAAIAGLIAVVNTTFSEKEVGEKYAYNYNVCERYVGGAKGVSHCTKYVPAVEYRQKILVKGLFFNYESYIITSE